MSNIYKINIIEKERLIGIFSDGKLLASVLKGGKLDLSDLSSFAKEIRIDEPAKFEYKLDYDSKNSDVRDQVQEIVTELNGLLERVNQTGRMINDGSMTKMVNELLSKLNAFEGNRVCEICGEDISDRPSHHYLCYDCWKDEQY